ncbi:MAG: hypothetical protein EXX96DRAFT_563100 [Benjaminiella poitrasii]|nr:MAG: hypothetical protein EXX96DRAFT_563100 [Benjaminiella poitrasii]
MLHVQEPFVVHNSSNLLISNTTTATVLVQPQPSTSSRSTKVIEQLSIKYETIQKELANTKAQLEMIRQSKLRHEQDFANHTTSNRQHRARIKDIMLLLETKQTNLLDTKRSSANLESKVKQLKDEAHQSRHQLEDLRRRAHVLERDRDEALRQRNQLELERRQLQESVNQSRACCERELAELQDDYHLLVHHADYVRERNKELAELIHVKLGLRRQSIEHMAQLKRQSLANTRSFVDYVEQELNGLTESQWSTKGTDLAAVQCREEFHGLLKRIKTAIAEELAAEK